MFKFDQIDVKRLAVSALGAAVFSTACVGAAVAPANAAAPATVDAWQANVETKLADQNDIYSPFAENRSRAQAVMAVRFTADGDYAGADLARSTGKAKLDRHAMKVATHIAYPQLPESLRGRPQTVAMRLNFGGPESRFDARRRAESVKFVDAGQAASDVVAVK